MTTTEQACPKGHGAVPSEESFLSCRTKLRFTIAVFVAATLVLQIFRLVFIGYFEGLNHLAEVETWRALYLGLKFDMRLVAILVVPVWLLLKPGRPGASSRWKDLFAALTLATALALYFVMVVFAMADDVPVRKWLPVLFGLVLFHRLAFKSYGLARNASARWIWMSFAGILVLVLGVSYLSDFGSYSYNHTRLCGSLLMFAENAGTSLHMVWESYPVVWLLLLMIALLAGAMFGLRRLAGGMAVSSSAPWVQRTTAAVGMLLLIACIYGKWSRYPLRWAEAFELKHSFNVQLALNPLLFFLETRAEMDGGFDIAKVRDTHKVMADYFGIPVALDQDGLPTLRREGRPLGHIEGEPNIVFIQMESLASFKTGIGGNSLSPTPFLDNLCRNGLYFDRFNVVMENTSRSIFATLFGIPDVSSVLNATRNPLLVDQHTVLNALDGRDRSYWLGGSANWAQIRAMLKNNFKGIEIHEEGSFPGMPVVDVWGVCDADLLLAAHAAMAAKSSPFWIYVQTSGNHPPFTIPSHLLDFHVETRTDSELTAAGFVSCEEYNAVRLMDYSIKRFFEAAEKAPYFQNTIFVLWADHGVPRGSRDPRFGDLSLDVHHIPFVIYSPGLVKTPQRIHTVGSQVDIMPTLMSLLGRPYVHQTLGKDLLDPAWKDKAAAFTFTTFRRPPRVGLIQGDFYLNLEPDGRPALYRLDNANPPDLAKVDPERTAHMKALAEGFHNWAKFLLSHNKTIPATP
jgi:phosphoglycerol transferase MdoB-like AlkP superfamily enzyme